MTELIVDVCMSACSYTSSISVSSWMMTMGTGMRAAVNPQKKERYVLLLLSQPSLDQSIPSSKTLLRTAMLSRLCTHSTVGPALTLAGLSV